jgi:hypothetical protein
LGTLDDLCGHSTKPATGINSLFLSILEPNNLRQKAPEKGFLQTIGHLPSFRFTYLCTKGKVGKICTIGLHRRPLVDLSLFVSYEIEPGNRKSAARNNRETGFAPVDSHPD